MYARLIDNLFIWAAFKVPRLSYLCLRSVSIKVISHSLSFRRVICISMKFDFQNVTFCQQSNLSNIMHQIWRRNEQQDDKKKKMYSS